MCFHAIQGCVDNAVQRYFASFHLAVIFDAIACSAVIWQSKLRIDLKIWVLFKIKCVAPKDRRRMLESVVFPKKQPGLGCQIAIRGRLLLDSTCQEEGLWWFGHHS